MNIINVASRAEFRRWLADNHLTAKDCWIAVKRGKTPPKEGLWYLDAVEEALCFGWIDSTLKNVEGTALQRFGRRSRSSYWSELNKERCRRLSKLGLMTESGRAACPDLDAEFVIMAEIVEAFGADSVAWANFRSFPALYQRVRIDNIQRNKACPEMFEKRLTKLIEASGRGEMIGDWNDGGRLLKY